MFIYRTFGEILMLVCIAVLKLSMSSDWTGFTRLFNDIEIIKKEVLNHILERFLIIWYPNLIHTSL